MTLPSEGINPWRTIPAHGKPIDTPNRLPIEKLTDSDSVNSLNDKNVSEGEFKPFGDDGFTFRDFIDIINPLQHIPVISTMYRNMTEDNLDPAPRIMGSTLFMGPIGLAASVANVLVEHNTGKDVGEHVVAYFQDDAGPLTAGNNTGQTNPAAAGTDGVDPVTAWAQEQLAFYQAGSSAQPNAAANTNSSHTVEAWAQAQHEYYRSGAATTQQQTAGYIPSQGMENAAVGGPLAAAGTDGIDPVTAWARAQTAAHATAGNIDPVTEWARAQTASYASNHAGAEQVRGSHQVATNALPAAAGTDGIDPVTAWAQAQTASNHTDSGNIKSHTMAALNTAPAAAGTDGIDPVTAWAQEQLAWVHGDRTQEVAAAAPVQQVSARNTSDTRGGSSTDGSRQPGAAAVNGGWFQENMVDGWTKYHAAQKLAEPGYRPGLDIR